MVICGLGQEYMSLRRNKVLFLFTLIAGLFVNIGGSSCIAQEKIKIGFSELPPYMTGKLEKHGVAGLLLEKALEGKGEIQLVPVVSVRLPYLINMEEVVAGVTTDNDLCNKTTDYVCTEIIKTISVVLAYRPETVEFANISSLDELKKDLNSIGQQKEYTFFDKEHNLLKFKEMKDDDSGLKLLWIQRLKGLLINADVFDYNKAHKIIDQSMKKSNALSQIPIRIIVKNNDKTKWIIQSINEYMKTNTYDSIFLDYYLNYATANQ